MVEVNTYWLAKYLNDYILQNEKIELEKKLEQQPHIQEQIDFCPSAESIQMYLLNRHVLNNKQIHHIRFCSICKKRLEFADYVHAQFHLLGMAKHLGEKQTKVCFEKLDPYFRKFLLEKHYHCHQQPKSSLNFQKAPHHLKNLLQGNSLESSELKS